MTITQEEKVRKERGKLAREFLQSELFQKYLLVFMEQKRLSGYPRPDEKGWEEKYRMAFARDEVYTELVQAVQSWEQEAKDIESKEEEEEKDVILA
jgi:hypothetical protein